MPVYHNLTATTPDDPRYEIRPSHWNSEHAVLITHASEISGAFSNDAAYNVSFTTIAGNKIVASANVTAAPSPVNVTGANGSSVNAQTIAFSNSNGLSLGVSTAANGATVTGSYTVPTQSQQPMAASANNGSFTANTLSFSNANGISFGTSAGSAITASHNGLTTARASNDGIGLNTAQSNVTWTANSSGLSLDARGYAGTATSVTGGAAVTLNSNGLAFNGASLAGTSSGFTGANISATITNNTAGLALSMSVAAPGGAASQTLYATGNTTVNSSGTMALSSLLMRGYGVVSLGTSNGSILVSSPDPSTLAPSWYAVGNTTGASSSTTFAADTISVQGTGGVSVGYSNGSLVISGNTGGGGGGGVGLSAGTQSVSTGTVVYSNSNNISFGMSGSSRVTAQAALNLYALGNTTQNSSSVLDIQSVSLNGLGALTVGYSNGSVQLSAPATSSLVAGANITISTAGSTISVIGGAGAGNPVFSAGTSSASLGSVVFSDSNGVSFGLNGSTMTASHNGLTTARASNDAIGLNTAQSNVTWTVNSSGLSLDARGYAGTATTFNGTNASASITLNSAGLRLDLSAAAAGGASPVVSAANGSYSFTTLSFSNANGVSFGTSAGSAVTASVAAQTNQTLGGYFVGNTTGQSSSSTVDARSLSFDGAGIVSAGFSNGTIRISATQSVQTQASGDIARSGFTSAGNNIGLSGTLNSGGLSLSATVAAQTVQPVAVSANNGSYAFSTLSFSNANGVSFGTSAGSAVTASYTVPTVTQYFSATNTTFNGANISGSMTLNTNGLQLSMSVAAPGAAAENNAINLLGANTAGNTTATGSTIGLSGVNLTLSGTNASQVVISAPATSSLSATGQLSISTNGSTISIGVGRTISGLVLAPFGGLGGPIPFAQSSISLGQNSLYMYPVQIEDYLSMDHIRMPVLVTNSSSAVSSGQKGQTFQVGIYTRHSTNGTLYSRHYSTSYTVAASYSSNVSWAQSMITAIGNSTSYNTVTASSAGLNLSASLHGPRELILPVSSVFAPGEYMLAVVASTSGAGTVGNVLNISNMAGAYQTYNRFGVSTNSTESGFFKFMGAGKYSATTGALPASISATQINQLGTLPMMFAATGTV